MELNSERDLVNAYTPQIQAELERIGFTDQGLLHVGVDRPFSAEKFEALLEVLREVPDHAGARALLQRLGLDADEILGTA